MSKNALNHKETTMLKPPKRILVPIDMSTFSLSALLYAEDIADYFGAEIIVAHVAEEGDPVAKAYGEKGSKDSKEDVERRIKSAISHLLIDHNVVTKSIRIEIRHGSPAVEIVRLARQAEADLIVMSTHGRGGLSHMLLGSVAEKVVRIASCPVLTMKPDEFRELVNITEDDVTSGLHLG